MKYKVIIILESSCKPTNYCNPATLFRIMSFERGRLYDDLFASMLVYKTKKASRKMEYTHPFLKDRPKRFFVSICKLASLELKLNDKTYLYIGLVWSRFF